MGMTWHFQYPRPFRTEQTEAVPFSVHLINRSVRGGANSFLPLRTLRLFVRFSSGSFFVPWSAHESHESSPLALAYPVCRSPSHQRPPKALVENQRPHASRNHRRAPQETRRQRNHSSMVHHHAEQIVAFLKSKTISAFEWKISREDDLLLDTGGGLKRASWFFLKGTQ